MPTSVAKWNGSSPTSNRYPNAPSANTPALIATLTHRLLGSHARRSALHHQAHLVEDCRQVEISQHAAAFAGHHDVRRFDIAIRDSVTIGVAECVGAPKS
jgi:hypothetical protein